MKKRPSLSLASLSVNPSSATSGPSESAKASNGEPQKDIKISSDKAINRLQVAFRMDKDAYKELRRMALDEDKTVNALLLEGVNLLRAEKGLPALKD
jgi:hypothetical protein